MPGILINILQCAGQSPSTKNYPVQNVNSTGVRNPTLYIEGLKKKIPKPLSHLNNHFKIPDMQSMFAFLQSLVIAQIVHMCESGVKQGTHITFG